MESFSGTDVRPTHAPAIATMDNIISDGLAPVPNQPSSSSSPNPVDATAVAVIHDSSDNTITRAATKQQDIPPSSSGVSTTGASDRPRGSGPGMSSPFLFTQISVTDFDRAHAFFEKVFGWKFVSQTPCTPTVVDRDDHMATPAATGGALDDERGNTSSRQGSRAATSHHMSFFTDGRSDTPIGALFMFAKADNAVAEAASARHSLSAPASGPVLPAAGGADDLTQTDQKEDISRSQSTRGNHHRKQPGVVTYVGVPDIDATLGLVVAAGGKVIRGKWISGADSGGGENSGPEQGKHTALAQFADTEGNVFGLISPVV